MTHRNDQHLTMRTLGLSLALFACLLSGAQGGSCAYHYRLHLKKEFHRLCYGVHINEVVCTALTKKLTFCGVACQYICYLY